jgi:hypothetical protein
MNSRITGPAQLFFITIFFGLFFTISVSAQEARGTISGKVKDATQAVIPGAIVKIKNVAMGTTVSVTANDAGIFQAPYLIPGTYQLTIEHTGFKKYIRDGLILSIGATLDVDILLEVGRTEETVTITDVSPPLDTTSASMGQTVDSRRVSELPLVHGDPYTLIGLSAGVSFGRDPKLDRPFEPTHIVGYAMDGTRANRSDLTIDGVTSTATANANEVTASYVPPADIIQEFKVQTATFDAQFGNTEGGVTSIAIKSGTNALHGTAYFWGEPGSLAGNDAFGNAAGTPRPDTFSNRFGWSVGGPVYLPKVYDGRNKTFFLWGYENIQDARPRNGGTPTVPTLAMRNGDFSALNFGRTAFQLHNPYSRRPDPDGRFRQDPFLCDPSGNPLPVDANKLQVDPGTPCNKIPQQLFNPVSQALLGYFPAPLTTGRADGTQNFQQAALKEEADYYTSTIRIDHVISDKQRIFGRGSWYDRNSTYNNYFDNLATGTLFRFISRQAAIDDVYTLNPTTVLNLRYGYNRLVRVDGYNPASNGFDLTSVGLPASYNAAIPEDRRSFPAIDIGGYQGTRFNNETRPIDTHSFIATLNKSAGSHSLKGGAEYRIYRENSINLVNDASGRFNFDSTWTRGPLDTAPVTPDNLGYSFASFLLGLPSPTNSYISRPADYAEQSSTWGFFVHDDWKFNSRLTLNLGLRYEFETPISERYNRSVRGFDYNFIQPGEAAVQAAYANINDPRLKQALPQISVRGGLTFAGVNGEPEGLYDTPKHNLMPRLGLAFKLNEKTVLRAGYGMFFGFLGQRRGDVNQAGFSRNTNLVVTNNAVDPVTGRVIFITDLSNPFPNGIQEPLGASQGPLTFLDQNITFFNPNPSTPYNQRWELGFQREMSGGWIVEAAYVGNRGTNIEITRNINATPQKYLSTSPVRDKATFDYLTGTVTNPFLGNLPGTPINNSATIARERLLRPFPQFGQVITTTNDGYSWYHALQARIEKRLSRGFTFQGSYTFSKFMQASEVLNQDDLMPTEMISDSDYPHRFSATAIYDLPFGKGQKFLNTSNGIASRIVGGWQVQGLYYFQSGAPIGFNTPPGNNPNARTSGYIYNGDLREIRLPGDQQEAGNWFNTDGFVRDSASQLDWNVRTFPYRFAWARFPRQNNFDLSLAKNTALTEGIRLQFRAEFINAFNRVWLANPNGTNGLITDPVSTSFGQVTGSVQANYPRRMQLGLKLLF